MARPKKKPPKQHARGWHEGTVREVRPGVWRAWRARQHKADGTIVRPSQTFSGSDAEARAKRWAVGEPEPAVMYVGQWLERWLALREPRLRVRTREGYRSHIAWCGDLLLRPLASVTEDDWQFRANELLETLARDTVRNWRSTVSSALKAAVPRYLTYNPMTLVHLPTRNEQMVRAFTPDELTTFLRACIGSRYEMWVHVSLGTGLRLSESRGLTWDKVDLTAQTILVDSALDQVNSAVGPTKTGRIRLVDIPDELVLPLRLHRARQQPSEQYVIGSGRAGRPIGASTLRDFVKRTCERNGLRELGPHALRHSYATHSLEGGVALKEVSETLGHANIGITSQVYSHAVRRQRRQAANVMGQIIKESLSPPVLPIGTQIGTQERG